MKRLSSRFYVGLEILLFLISAQLLTGCATIVGYERLYDGGPRALSDVAILTHPNPYSQTTIINKIDGENRVLAGVVELPPGRHSICAGFIKSTSEGTHSSQGCSTAVLDAKPGHIYVIYEQIRLHDHTWNPAVRDITAEIGSPVMKDLADKIDAVLTKHRGAGPGVSVRSLAKGAVVPPAGFGETKTASLKRWLGKDVNVTYDFHRYRLYPKVEGDDDVDYYLQLDEKSGDVTNVFGRRIDVGGKFASIDAYQPLKSDLAYIRSLDPKQPSVWYKDRTGVVMKGVKSIWRQQKDGTYSMVIRQATGSHSKHLYRSLLNTRDIEHLPRQAINALVLAGHTDPQVLSPYPHIQSRLQGQSKEGRERLLQLESFRLAAEVKRLMSEANTKAGSDVERKSFNQAAAKVRNVLTKNLFGGPKPKIPYAHTKVKFFQTPYEMTAYGERKYSDVFSQRETTFVGWELNLEIPARQKRLDYRITAVWAGPDETIFTHQVRDSYIEPSWTRPWSAMSWGYRAPGKWAPGVYMVEFYINGHYADSRSFTVQ